MHRFIVTSIRSVTAEFSRSTWRPIVADDATIGGHCRGLFMCQSEFESSEVLTPSTPFTFGVVFRLFRNRLSSLCSRIVKLRPGFSLTLL